MGVLLSCPVSGLFVLCKTLVKKKRSEAVWETLKIDILTFTTVFHNVHTAVSAGLCNRILHIRVFSSLRCLDWFCFKSWQKRLLQHVFRVCLLHIRKVHLASLGRKQCFSQCSRATSDVFHLKIFEMRFFLSFVLFGLRVYQVVKQKLVCRSFWRYFLI
jgi:hypothetical protein